MEALEVLLVLSIDVELEASVRCVFERDYGSGVFTRGVTVFYLNGDDGFPTGYQPVEVQAGWLMVRCLVVYPFTIKVLEFIYHVRGALWWIGNECWVFKRDHWEVQMGWRVSLRTR